MNNTRARRIAIVTGTLAVASEAQRETLIAKMTKTNELAISLAKHCASLGIGSNEGTDAMLAAIAMQIVANNGPDDVDRLTEVFHKKLDFYIQMTEDVRNDSENEAMDHLDPVKVPSGN